MMTSYLLSLETLKAQDETLSDLISCTESDIQKLTSHCLSALKRHLDWHPQSRDGVTAAVVTLWTASHLAFLSEYDLEDPHISQVYKLSGAWLRQRLLVAQLSSAVPAIHFAQYVTLGREPWEGRNLEEDLLQEGQLALMQSSLGLDAAFLSASEILADTLTQLYRIDKLPYELDLWPLAATLLGWDELMGQISFGS